jgi:serine/threonine protein kinase
MAVPHADPHPGPSVMVEELTRYEFETLSDDGSLALFRGRSRDGQSSILVRCPSGNSFTTIEHERLSREYSLANEFDEAWAARPRLLGEWAGKPALVMSDPGGSLLSSIRRQSLDLEHFLRTAIAIARSLRHLHNKGLIHRDLRPANLLLDENWRVWLTGFGMTTTLPRERVAPILAEGASDSLKYMAPEQTGRMNRSVDHRADLYSLGVILYELLSGRLPFRATEPIEWVHSHIARAGVGTTWYTWLEQGREIQPSNEVLSALAEVLRLDPAERHHLFSLYDRPTPEGRLPGEEHIGEPLRHVVDGLAGQPAFVLGWRWDPLTWNRPAEVVSALTLSLMAAGRTSSTCCSPTRLTAGCSSIGRPWPAARSRRFGPTARRISVTQISRAWLRD